MEKIDERRKATLLRARLLGVVVVASKESERRIITRLLHYSHSISTGVLNALLIMELKIIKRDLYRQGS